MEIEPPDSLYGLYQGTPLPERTWAYGNTLPDRITIFQRPIEEDCEDEDDVRAVIGETLIHEVGPLLRAERGGDRGDRGAVLARRDARPGRGRRRSDAAYRARASGSASTSSSRRGSPSWSTRHRARARRHVPRDRPRPRRADRGAGRRASRGSSPSRSTATWPRRSRRAVPPNVRVVEGDFLDDRPRRRCSPASRGRVRVVGNLPYNVVSPILVQAAATPPAAGRTLRDATRDAAEGGRRPARGHARDRPTTARWPSRSRSSPTSSGVLTLPPGRVPSAAQGDLGGRAPALPPARASTSATRRPSSAWSAASSCSAGRRCSNALKPVAAVARPFGRGTDCTRPESTRENGPRRSAARGVRPLSRAVL